MRVRIVQVKRQPAVGARAQGNKPRIVVSTRVAHTPVERPHLGEGRGHRPGDEAWLEKGPNASCTVSRPEGITIVRVKYGCSSRAGSKTGTEGAGGATHHGFKPGLSGHGRGIDAGLELSRHVIKCLGEGLIYAPWFEHVRDGI